MGPFVAWPYPSGDRQMGHVAAAYVPPDIFARYHHARGKDVIFVSGSDRAEQEELLWISEFADPAWRLWLHQPVCGGNGWFPGRLRSVPGPAVIGQPLWPSWHVKLP